MCSSRQPMRPPWSLTPLSVMNDTKDHKATWVDEADTNLKDKRANRLGVGCLEGWIAADKEPLALTSRQELVAPEALKEVEDEVSDELLKFGGDWPPCNKARAFLDRK